MYQGGQQKSQDPRGGQQTTQDHKIPEAANKNPKIPEAAIFLHEDRGGQQKSQDPRGPKRSEAVPGVSTTTHIHRKNVVIPHSLSPNIGPATGTRQWVGRQRDIL